MHAGPAAAVGGPESHAPSGFELVMISRESPEENHAKVKEHGLSFPVLLQKQLEVSRAYAFFATPVAYLINEAGVIAADVAVGADGVVGLIARAQQMRRWAKPALSDIKNGLTLSAT